MELVPPEEKAMALSQFCRIKWEQAKALRRQGRLAEAEQAMLQALDEAPHHSLLRSSLANLYLRQGKVSDARMLADEILKADPNCPEALVVRGEIASNEHRWPEALEDFEHAWRIDPQPFLVRRRGRALMEMGRYPDALEVLNNALIADRENVSFLKQKALVLNRMQRWEEALELYEKIRHFTPEDLFVQKEMLRLKGLSRPADKMIKELRTAVGISSRQDDAQLHGLLAQKLREAGQVQEAAAEYRTASDLSPDNLYFLKQQGFCHYNLHEYDKAMECLGRAFRGDPADFYVKRALEKIYSEAGRQEDFLALLEQVQSLHPHQRKLMGWIKKARKLLQAKEDRNPQQDTP
jgi:tetratricopeptide (TPR) repeat protein